MPVINEIYSSIREKGYINLERFMEIALTESRFSYYRNRNPLGENADFITSPEISQMFGEMIGVFIYDAYIKMGSPQKLNIVELGPGRGTLIRDALNALKKTSCFPCLEITFLEVNEKLIEKQRSALEKFDININWIDDKNKFPKGPSIFISNEFFDALPVTQYVKVKDEWKEVILRINPKDSKITFDRIPILDELNSHLLYEYPNSIDGAIIEESRQVASHIKEIISHLQKNSGVSLIIDYGYDVDPKDRRDSQFFGTLQAVKNHKFVPVLSDFGKVDLTCHVDFWMIKKILNFHQQKYFGTINQGEFLDNMGIKLRLDLLKKASPDMAKILDRQYKRLTQPDKMGELFKVLVHTNLDGYVPLGFYKLI